MTLVRAKVSHIEPETLAYRTEGDEFERKGKLYKHVELASKPAAKPKSQDDYDDGGLAAADVELKNV